MAQTLVFVGPTVDGGAFSSMSPSRVSRMRGQSSSPRKLTFGNLPMRDGDLNERTAGHQTMKGTINQGSRKR